MKKAYCLYRVSSMKKGEEHDIPMQRTACHAFAEKQGWEIVKEFSEHGVSGYKLSMKGRDALQTIRQDACLKKFDILLVFMFDRIGRRDDETPFVVEYLVDNGIAVWSVREGEQRFDNHVDKLINYIRYWQASGESYNISERTKTRIGQLTEEGHFTGGNNAYGYDLVLSDRLNRKKHQTYTLKINEKEAAVVRLIFQKAASEGFGAERIAKFLNEEGYTTRSEKPWNPASIRNILKNKLYIGVLSKGEATSAALENLRIVDDELFEAVQEMRQSRQDGNTAEKTIPRNTLGQALLSGFLFCGHCGSRVNSNPVICSYTRKNGTISHKKYPRYRCNRKVDGFPVVCDGAFSYSAEKVDRLFEQSILSVLNQLSEYSIEQIVELKYQVSLTDLRKQECSLREKLLERENELELVMQEMSAALAGKSRFSSNVLEIMDQVSRSKIADIHVELAEIKSKIQDADKLRYETQYYYDKFMRFTREYETATVSAKKVMLSDLISKVEIRSGYEIEIILHPEFKEFIDSFDSDK